MRLRWATFCGLLVLASLAPLKAAADQPHDWILNGAGDKGTYLNLDVILGAFQVGVEHRIPIYGAANALTLRSSGMLALPFASTQADVEVRIIVLTLGMSVGGQNVWRNQSFEPDQPLHRKERRERDTAGEFNDESWGFWEGRASLVFPFNEYSLFLQQTSYREIGMPDRTFDIVNGVVHNGNIVKAEFIFFLKHRDYGGFAPTLQLLDFELDGKRHTQVNVGAMIVTRAGLVRRDDVMLFQVTYHPGDVFGGYDNTDVYGAQLLRGPLTIIFAYRSQIQLWDGDSDD